MERSLRFKEDKELIPAEARWHGELSSTLGKVALSRVPSVKTMVFPTAERRTPKPTIDKHAYDLQLSTLNRVCSAKWASRKELREREARVQRKQAGLRVSQYQQYPGERPSTIGSGANVRVSSIRSSPAVSIKRRPPLSILSAETLKNNSHYMANSYSSFGVRPDSSASVRAAPRPVMGKAEPSLKLARVAPSAQYPLGQTSSFGKQAASTHKQAPAARIARRGEVNPLPRQWTDVGPGAYVPPSTFGNGGVKMPKRTKPRHRDSAAARAAASGEPPQMLAQHEGFTSLKEWHECHPGATKKTKKKPARRAKKVKQPHSLKDWLDAFGEPTKGTMFNYMVTRRPTISRGMSTGNLKKRASSAAPTTRGIRYSSSAKALPPGMRD